MTDNTSKKWDQSELTDIFNKSVAELAPVLKAHPDMGPMLQLDKKTNTPRIILFTDEARKKESLLGTLQPSSNE